MTQTIIRIKVPAKLKKEMEEIKIDWNDYIYQCFGRNWNGQNEKFYSAPLMKFERVTCRFKV